MKYRPKENFQQKCSILVYRSQPLRNSYKGIV